MASTDKPPLPELTTKIVFLSRLDTYFGKVLAQHLSHIAIDQHGVKSENPDKSADVYDLTFLDKPAKFGSFKVFGTWHPEEPLTPYEPAKKHPRLPAIQGMCPSDSYGDIVKMINAADICIFNLVDDDGENECLESTIKAMEITRHILTERTLERPKKLILVSTAMTWAKTKQVQSPLSKDDGEAATKNRERPVFSEEEYRRRLPHPSFRRHWELEKQFLELADDTKGILTTVVAAGTIYGYGENLFNWMFKKAWLCRPVKILDDGKALIPTIHIRDLCQLVEHVCINETKNRYILGVDEGNYTLENICSEVSKALSDGSVEYCEPDEMLMRKKILPVQYDVYTTSLRLESSTMQDIPTDWVAPNGCIEAMASVVREYRAFRNLLPLRIVVTGLPFSGKTTLAKHLSDDYKTPYVYATEVAQNEIVNLEKKLDDMKSNRTAVDSSKSGEKPPSEAETELQTLLASINKDKEKNGGHLSDVFVSRFVREKLGSLPCKNQGYVLDGYPPSYASAADLFPQKPQAGGKKDDNRSLPEESEALPGNRKTLPEFVFFLDGPAEVIKQRIMTHTPGAAPGEPPLETTIAQKFAEFNLINTDEDSNLVYFDEIGVPVIVINTVQDGTSVTPEKILRSVQKRIGPPRTLPLTKDKKKRLLREEAQRQVLLDQENRQKEAFREKVERSDKERRCQQWAERLREEEERNRPPEDKSVLPLRRYLMTYVMPVLTDGMMKCAADRPKDPVDFLAAYLVQNSQPLYLQEGLVPFKQMTTKAARKKEKAMRDRRVSIKPATFPDIVPFEDENQLRDAWLPVPASGVDANAA